MNEKENIAQTAPRISTKAIATGALLTAANVVLNEYFGLKTELLKINFGFVSLVLAAVLYGPKMSVTVAVLGDILGLMLFPVVGTPNPIFTIITGMVGLTYGLLLYRKGEPYSGKTMVIRGAIAGFLVTGVIYTGLNSLALGYLYGEAYIIGAMPARIIKNIVLFAINVVVIPMVFTLRNRLAKSNINLQ